MSSMTLEEQEKQILREIEELKLENELVELEETRNKQLQQWEERLRGKQGAMTKSHDGGNRIFELWLLASAVARGKAPPESIFTFIER